MKKQNRNPDNLLSNPRKALLGMAVPLFFSILVGNLQSFIDGVWCSGLGSDELSAISISKPIYTLLISSGAGMGIGASAAVAKYIGAGDRSSADRTASCTIVLTVAIAIFSSIAMWFLAEPLIRYCGGNNNVGLCMDYTVPFLYMSFFLMMNGIWAGLLRAEGASKVSMLLSITASLLNIILDPMFIYGLDMGVKGASIATCASFMATTVIGFYWYLSGRTYIRLGFRKFRFEKVILYEIALAGVPCALEMILSHILIIPEQAMVVSCGGSDGLVVYVNAFLFVDLVLIPAMAVSKSLLPILSAAVGQRDLRKFRECCRLTFRIVLTMEACMAVFLFLGADIFVEAFMNSDSMRDLRSEMVMATRIYSLTCIFNSILGVGMSIMQASRHAFLTTLMTFIREFLFLGTFFVASRISMEAIYWSLDLTNFLSMMLVYYLSVIAIRKLENDLGHNIPCEQLWN